VIEILKRSGIAMAGQHAVVVGRSDIVGKPAAMLLLHQNATVTICHSKTRDLGAVTRRGGHSGGGDRAAGVHHGGDGEAGRDDHRCGHQPHYERAEFERYFAGNAKREAAFAKRGSTIVGDVHPKAFEWRAPIRRCRAAWVR
jgi:methylenetetrahydrofolate dehydrogenase (NADP+)/methenyltetrahydrofolate cyclohydrolase